jgi:autotransporter-associated beta strand protein
VTNWTSSDGRPVAVPQNGDDLVFPAGAANRDANDDIPNLSVRSITFQVGGYTTTASAGVSLAVTGSISDLASLSQNGFHLPLVLPNTIGVAVRDISESLLVWGAISGPGGITKTGAGTLSFYSFAGANTYKGLTQVSAGLLFLAQPGVLPGALTVGTGTGTPAQALLGSDAATGPTTAVTVNRDGLFAVGEDGSDPDLVRLRGLPSHSTIGSLTLNGGTVSIAGPQLSNLLPASELVLAGDVTTLACTTTATIRGGGALLLGGSTRTFTVAGGGANPGLVVSTAIGGGVPAAFFDSASGDLRVTQAGRIAGFRLSTFADSFPTSAQLNGTGGPVGIAFPGGGKVLVSDFPGNVRVFPADTDGQHASAVPAAAAYGANNALGIAQSGGALYMTQEIAGKLVQINADGTFKQDIVSIPRPLGVVANPLNGHLFVSSEDGPIFDVDPVAKTASVFVNAPRPDGLSIAPDGSVLYAAATHGGGGGHVLGYRASDGALVFDSGDIGGQPGSLDGMALGAGGLAGRPGRGGLLELLAETEPSPGQEDLRGFEWHFFNRLCHADQLSLKGHTDRVSSVCFSPDGRRLASAGWSYDGLNLRWLGEVNVWDAQTGQKLLTLKGYAQQVANVCFSPDGRRLASTSGDHLVKVWDAQTGQEQLTLKGHSSGVRSVCFSPDGRRLATASMDRTVRVWDAQTGQQTLSIGGQTNEDTSVCFSPDGRRLASASGDIFKGEVKVWDAQTGQETLTLKGHTAPVSCVCFSPDGRRLASASGDRTVKVWDAQTGQEQRTLIGHSAGVCDVCFSPDGRRLATASDDHTVKVWEAHTGQELLTLRGHAGGVQSVCFSPDGHRLASASYDGTVKVWDAQSNQEARTFQGHTARINVVCFSPDGRRLVAASQDGTVKVWEAQTGQELGTLQRHTGAISCVCFSPDGRRLASASGDQSNPGKAGAVKVWDAQTGQELLTLRGYKFGVQSVCFSPDGRRLATAGGWRDTTVKVWDAQTGQEQLTLKGHTRPVTSVCFSPDGGRLASAGHYWDGDGRVWKGEAKVWDAQTGQEILSLHGHTAPVTSVCFSPDGRRLASASHDSTVKVWDAQTGQEQLPLKGHTAPVTSVCFSPDGKRLATASQDETVRVWEAETGQETLTLKGHTRGVNSVCFSPDGHRLASASEDQTVKVWDAVPIHE